MFDEETKNEPLMVGLIKVGGRLQKFDSELDQILVDLRDYLTSKNLQEGEKEIVEAKIDLIYTIMDNYSRIFEDFLP